MADKFKDAIRKRATDGAQYLYRGGDLDTIAEMARTGRVTGAECGEITGSFRGDPPIVQTAGRPDSISDLDWDTGPTVRDEVYPITGGFTDQFGQTKRFQGSYGTVAVLDRAEMNVEKVEYDREWMDNHPGALCHILTTAGYEVRLDGEGLYGIASSQPLARGGRTLRVDHWGSLPATTEESRFANESEYVAFSQVVSVGNALEAVVSRLSEGVLERRAKSVSDSDPDSAEDAAQMIYDHLKRQLPLRVPVAVIVTDDGASRVDEAWLEPSVNFVVTEDGVQDRGTIPQYYRGEQP
jgi:hypothetical protein